MNLFFWKWKLQTGTSSSRTMPCRQRCTQFSVPKTYGNGWEGQRVTRGKNTTQPINGCKAFCCTEACFLVWNQWTHWRMQGWGAGGPAPLASKILSKSCSFQAIVREKPYFEQILGSSPLWPKSWIRPWDQLGKQNCLSVNGRVWYRCLPLNSKS